jgi:hypothetical protein
MEITREIIIKNINNPELLEDLYQSNKKAFSEIIKLIYEEDASFAIKYWHARLFRKPLAKKNNVKKYAFVALSVIFTWIPIRLALTESYVDNHYLLRLVPVIFSITLSLFFLFDSRKLKNVALCVFLNIAVYVCAIAFPPNGYSQVYAQALNNAFYFMFVLLWFFVLFAYSNCNVRKLNYSGFLGIVGETIVWSAIFLLGGSVVVGLSLGLFSAINVNASEFYLKNIVTLGIVASPFVSLLVIDAINTVKLSVIIANIFLPLILISLVVFGIASMFTNTKPYEDREMFIVYNVMMVVVVSVLVFASINGVNNKIINACSFVLPIVVTILDLVAISAVIYRLNKYGMSANKITLLGTNVIMLCHLVYMAHLRARNEIELNVRYLPAYFLWAVCVVFILPFISWIS